MRRPLKLALLLSTAVALPFLAVAAEQSDTVQLLKLFGDVFERVRSDYVEPVKDSDLIEAALNGMLSSLDPHSSYMNAKAFGEMQVQTKGEFGGLGIEVTMDNGLIKVVSPIDDTPAAKAGLKPGDYIAQINDEPVTGMTLSDAVEKMRGPVDSKVKLTILREDVKEPLVVSLKRAIIKIKAVKARAEGDIAYLRVISFSEQTTDLLKSEFDRIKKTMPAVHGVVLDLRNNPGGLLEQAISVSDAFLKQGEIVSTRERDPSHTKRYNAHAGDELVPDNVPVVVLINAGSASASEIVSGALQDHKRAIVMGIKSFGKGSVQTVIPIPDHGAIRLTTARYYTPSGHSIQAKGIVPDVVVEQAKIEAIKTPKQQMEADLKKRLANLEDKDKKDSGQKGSDKPVVPKDLDAPGVVTPLSEVKTDDQKAKETKALTPDADLDPSQDYQLQRALDLLHGIGIYQQQTATK